jgi:hypothetical protein
MQQTSRDANAEYSATDWKSFDALSDAEITDAALLDPDAPPLTDKEALEFRRASEIPGKTFIEKSHLLVSEDKNRQLASNR